MPCCRLYFEDISGKRVHLLFRYFDHGFSTFVQALEEFCALIDIVYAIGTQYGEPGAYRHEYIGMVNGLALPADRLVCFKYKRLKVQVCTKLPYDVFIGPRGKGAICNAVYTI